MLQVHILLPPLTKLRSIVDRMRPLSERGIWFRANLSGQLQLSAAGDDARVDINWQNLANPPMSEYRLSRFIF